MCGECEYVEDKENEGVSSGQIKIGGLTALQLSAAGLKLSAGREIHLSRIQLWRPRKSQL